MAAAKIPPLYILVSGPRGTLYVGVTSDLVKRVWKHRNEVVDGSPQVRSRRPGLFEVHPTLLSAIACEKAMKEWKRACKATPIEKTNPDWRDLYDEVSGAAP